MPKLMKPPIDGRGATAGEGFYDGPLPKPALYKGKVSYLALGKIKSGTNSGQQKLVVMCTITEGPFKGAGVGKNLQLSEQGAGWVNQFLHSLTDGSEAQKKGIEEAFYGTGYVLADETKNGLTPILKIGKKTNPVGVACNFVVTNRTIEEGDRKGETVADISRFVSKRNDEESEAAVEDPEDDFADALAAADDSDDDDSTAATDLDTSDDDDAVVGGADDGDPWSV